MTKFLLIRHATTDSVGKLLSGRMPGVHLNEEGQLQASQLAERLEGVSIQAVYSSPLERAMETAAPLSSKLQMETMISHDFLELDFGEWTNMSFEALKTDPMFREFNLFRSAARVPGGELMLEGQLRMVRGLEQLCTRHNNQTVAVISHSDMIRAALSYYAGIHLDMFQRIEISPASVSIVEIYRETARILLINHTGNIIL